MLIQPKVQAEGADKIPDGVNPRLVSAFKALLEYAFPVPKEITDSERQNIAQTPIRAAKAFASLVRTKAQIIEDTKEILSTSFPTEETRVEPGVITQGPITIHSLCPHHLLMVQYQAFVAYKPHVGGAVLGLSKLARLAQALGRRPVLQEQLARDIADCLHFDNNLDDNSVFAQIRTEGSAVQLLGHHSCMSCRGVKEDALTVTTELRGSMTQSSKKAEFEQAILSIRQAK